MRGPSVKPSRVDMLANLADNINELTQPRKNVEAIESSVTVTVETGRRKKVKRIRQRRMHIVEFPSLMDSLAEAAQPGQDGTQNGSAGYESRPSADLEPLAVLTMIETAAVIWSNTLDTTWGATWTLTLSAFVSAHHTDAQLFALEDETRDWVKRARIATGLDAPPITLGDPCPHCGRRNALVITGDLTAARCQRCLRRWTPDTIGLLSQMLTANTHDTLTRPRCVWLECAQTGEHDTHNDWRGNAWRDRCDLTSA